jgi:hypothetical protein
MRPVAGRLILALLGRGESSIPAISSLTYVAPPDGFEPPTPALGRLRSIH